MTSAIRGVRSSVLSTPLKKMDQTEMHLTNCLTVLYEVRTYGPISRTKIAKRTELSPTTVSSIMLELANADLVLQRDSEDVNPKGGRKPTDISFNAQAGYVVGVDVGSKHLVIVLLALDGSSLYEKYVSEFALSNDPDKDLEFVAAEILSMLQEQARSKKQSIDRFMDRLLGIGVGLPGAVDTTREVLIRVPSLPEWTEVPVAAILESRLGITTSAIVHIDNDANLGAIGITSGFGRWPDKLTQAKNLAYVKLGTGIGSGLILNQEPYRGSFGSAGEFGHTTVLLGTDAPICRCGSPGCLEAVAGANKIVENANRLRGHSGTSRHLQGGGDIKDIDDVIVHARDNNDPACRMALMEAGYYIGVALADLINLLNPEFIMLGGRIAAAARADSTTGALDSRLLRDPISDQLRAHLQCSAGPQWTWDGNLLVAPKLDRAVAIGGAASILELGLHSFLLEKIKRVIPV